MKKARQAVKHSIRNKTVSTYVKTVIKKVEAAILAGVREDADKALTEAIRGLNKAASKGIIHRNTASRHISRLSKKVNKVSSVSPASPQAEAA